jgi:hypothetical protein
MLAYYVEWHMREAWRERLFTDTEQQTTATRDPMAPAQRSTAELAKVTRRARDDGTPVYSFATLMVALAIANAQQRRAFEGQKIWAKIPL